MIRWTFWPRLWGSEVRVRHVQANRLAIERAELVGVRRQHQDHGAQTPGCGGAQPPPAIPLGGKRQPRDRHQENHPQQLGHDAEAEG